MHGNTGWFGRRRGSVAMLVVTAGVLLATLVPSVGAAGAATRPDPVVLSGRTSKLSQNLQTLVAPAALSFSAAQQAAAVGLPEAGAGSLMQRDGGKLVVLVRFNDLTDATLAAAQSAGLGDLSISQSDLAADGSITPNQIPALVAVPGVRSVSEEQVPMVGGVDGATAHAVRAAAGAVGGGAATSALLGCPTGVVSEGDAQLKADLGRTNYSVNGAGVTVGVMSDSFNKLSGWSADITGNELPGAANGCGFATPVVVQSEAVSGGADEGRAMAQIVHDLAPGAGLRFASAFNGLVDFANQIRALKTNGAKVIVDDVTYFSEPMFQDGIIAKAVDDVVAGGVAYYSSAANSTLTVGGHDITSYEAGAYRPIPCPAAATTYGEESCHNFNQGGTDNGDTITVGAGQSLRLVMSYSQPQGGVTTDLDLLVLDGATGSLAFVSGNGNPALENTYEGLTVTNSTGSAKTYRIVVGRYTAGGDTATPRFKISAFPNGNSSALQAVQYNVSTGDDTVGPTIMGHNGAARAMSVAAVPYNSATSIEYYSSHGPVKQCWTPSTGTMSGSTYSGSPGTAISPCTTKTVDIAATDGGANNFFGSNAGGGIFRFYGTSAAAPHAAAVAALGRQKLPCAAPDQIYAAQRSTAVAMAYPTDTAGAGLLDANAMLGALTACLPGAPTLLTGVPGNAAITLTWQAPAANGSAITGYVVTPFVFGVARTPVTFNSTATTEIMTGLTNGTNYAFKVAAINGMGTGPVSLPSLAVIAGSPKAPGFQSASPGNASATVSFFPPANNGSAITGYVVTPYIGTVAQPAQTFNSTASSQVVTGLVNGTTYRFKVSARNARGTGPKSGYTLAIVVGAPKAPTSLTATAGVGQVSLGWVAPVDNGSAITGYVVTVYLSGVVQSTQTFNSTATAQVITGLTATKAYTFKVAAINAVGTGPQSALSPAAIPT
jgi:hypothetical protein